MTKTKKKIKTTKMKGSTILNSSGPLLPLLPLFVNAFLLQLLPTLENKNLVLTTWQINWIISKLINKTPEEISRIKMFSPKKKQVILLESRTYYLRYITSYIFMFKVHVEWLFFTSFDLKDFFTPLNYILMHDWMTEHVSAPAPPDARISYY